MNYFSIPVLVKKLQFPSFAIESVLFLKFKQWLFTNYYSRPNITHLGAYGQHFKDYYDAFYAIAFPYYQQSYI